MNINRMKVFNMKVFNALRDYLSEEDFELLLKVEYLTVADGKMDEVILSKMSPVDKFELVNHLLLEVEQLALLFENLKTSEDVIKLMEFASQVNLSLKSLECYNSYKALAIEEYCKHGIDYEKYEDLQLKLLELYSNEDVVNALVETLQ